MSFFLQFSNDDGSDDAVLLYGFQEFLIFLTADWIKNHSPRLSGAGFNNLFKEDVCKLAGNIHGILIFRGGA